MKHVDETMLLLAGGNVGEDLVARAEKRSVPSRRRVSLHFAALAACLCLIVGVAVPYVMDGFGSGNNAGCIGDISDKNAPETVCENGALPGDSAEKNASVALQELGIASAEDIVSVSAAPVSGAGQYGIASPQDSAAVRQEQSDALPGTGAELYALLVKSEAAPAEEDMPSLCPTARVTLTLASGAVLEGQYDAVQNLLEVGQWRFDLSEHW